MAFWLVSEAAVTMFNCYCVF